MGIIDQVYASFTVPLANLAGAVIETVPGIFFAIVLLAIGYAVAYLLGEALAIVLRWLKFEKWVLDHTGANAYVGGLRLNHLLGSLTKWYVWMLFWPSAAGIVVGFAPLSSFIVLLAVWVPRLIHGIVIALVGFVIAEYVAERIHEIKAKTTHIIADVFKVAIMLFTIFAALRVLTFDALAGSGALIVLASFGLALALALGIGFGLALKDEASKVIKGVRKKWK